MSLHFVLAQLKINPSEIGYDQGTTFTSNSALSNILELVYMWAGIVGVFVLIIASLFFVTARGNAAQMKRSKDAIQGTVIGLVIVMAAFAITRFVIGGVQG